MATSVGIRELKSNLSAFLERVERGEVVTITNHGRPVARVIPPEISEGLAELLADGTVVWSGKKLDLPAPLPLSGEGKTAAEYVDEIRG